MHDMSFLFSLFDINLIYNILEKKKENLEAFTLSFCNNFAIYIIIIFYWNIYVGLFEIHAHVWINLLTIKRCTRFFCCINKIE